MIDIEATGIQPEKEELLSIGILEATWDGQFWKPGRSKEWIVRCERQPESEFAQREMAALFAKCNAAPEMSSQRLRWEVLQFLRACGTSGPLDTYMMGWNASNFDLPFLAAKGLLDGCHYEMVDGKDQLVGDYHYRVYEIGGAVSLAQNACKEADREKLIADARAKAPDSFVPEGKKHDALWDCYDQLKLLNGLIIMARGSW